MNADNSLNIKQLVLLYEKSIINNELPDKEVTEKIISLRASLDQSSDLDCLTTAQSNVLNKIKDTYSMISLGTTDGESSLNNLNADVINSIFKNVLNASLSASRNLSEWNEGLNSQVGARRLDDRLTANEPITSRLMKILNEQLQALFR